MHSGIGDKISAVSDSGSQDSTRTPPGKECIDPTLDVLLASKCRRISFGQLRCHDNCRSQPSRCTQRCIAEQYPTATVGERPGAIMWNLDRRDFGWHVKIRTEHSYHNVAWKFGPGERPYTDRHHGSTKARCHILPIVNRCPRQPNCDANTALFGQRADERKGACNYIRLRCGRQQNRDFRHS